MIGQQFWQKTECWRIKRTINGFNGGGGFWLIEEWFWPDGRLCRSHPLTLSAEKSWAMLEDDSEWKPL